MLVVWCPDWPVVAAGAPPDSLTAVVHANRVVACSAAARAEGVRPGLRRREAQGRCPELELLDHDPARDARAFEPVLVAVERLTPWVEVLLPGECAFPARGAARYHGGEPALAVTVTAAVHAAVEGRGGPPVGRGRVGSADGTFTAGLAARRAGVAGAFSEAGLVGRHGVIVPPGGSRAFLAPLPVATLDRPDLADLLVRLGLRTLGDLAALPPADLATRFGAEGARAARLASGLDEHPKGARRPPPDLRVTAQLDPPADPVDVAAFTAKTLADTLVARLDRLGLACTRLRIEAETDQGETLARVWRYDPTSPAPRRPAGPDPVPRAAAGGTQAPGLVGSPGGDRPGPAGPSGRMAAVMTERVRWQLDGWLTGRAGRLPGALTRLTLAPDAAVPDRGRHLGFWGEETEAEQRAARALARIQGLLGPEAVHTARLRGGRDPGDRVTRTPADPPPSGSSASGVQASGSPPSGSPTLTPSAWAALASPPPALGLPASGSPSSDLPSSDPTAPDPASSLVPGVPGHGSSRPSGHDPAGGPGTGSGHLRR